MDKLLSGEVEYSYLKHGKPIPEGWEAAESLQGTPHGHHATLIKRHTMAVMTSSKDMTWATPQTWFDYLNLEFDFTLDPCCVPETAKCAKFYTPADDGLSKSWADERVFMNPPYGREIGAWMKKAYKEARDNMALVVCFVPARVDTNWWHDYAAKAADIRFPKGRVKFAGAENSAPFPIAIVIFRGQI